MPSTHNPRSRSARRILGRISGRLSSGRRGRLAAPLVLLLGLVVTGAMYSVLSPASANTRSDDVADVAKGRAIFLVGCASCHGKNAEGIPTVKGGQYGPSLVGVGPAAVDFQVGTGRMPMAQPGGQAMRKPPVYDAAEIRALGAFIASIGPGPAVPEPSQYKASSNNEDIVRGGEFFRTNCTACHNFAGSGGALPRGRYAPSLIGASGKHIYEAMITGPQQMPVFSDKVLSPTDKRQIISYLRKNEETPAYGGFTLGSIGPVSEGLVAWLAGIGALVGAAVWIAATSTRSRKKTNA